jgi:hypothetical protein
VKSHHVFKIPVLQLSVLDFQGLNTDDEQYLFEAICRNIKKHGRTKQEVLIPALHHFQIKFPFVSCILVDFIHYIVYVFLMLPSLS